ncbi:probable plastidic glucose transporter 3 [Arachis ipaensis]|uniref:probable plastidic glucose transporter 3 n=1 Tax=Arachis ipaensis TaxID=130454 RepID=UPI000A2B37D0|nr:probable plastidic glucose transporter 3 [Arachis ipaensis]
MEEEREKIMQASGPGGGVAAVRAFSRRCGLAISTVWVVTGGSRGCPRRRRSCFSILSLSVCSATKNLFGMLVRWLFVGTGLGLGPPAVALYVTEVSPAFVWGTNGALIQIATCLGILGALLIGALEMVFCAESPHWLYKELRATMKSVKNEVLKTKRNYLEDFKCLHVNEVGAELSYGKVAETKVLER